MAKYLGSDWLPLSIASDLLRDGESIEHLISEHRLPMRGRPMNPVLTHSKYELIDVLKIGIDRLNAYENILVREYSASYHLFYQVEVKASSFIKLIKRLRGFSYTGRPQKYSWEKIRTLVIELAPECRNSSQLFEHIRKMFEDEGAVAPDRTLFIAHGLHTAFELAKSKPSVKL